MRQSKGKLSRSIVALSTAKGKQYVEKTIVSAEKMKGDVDREKRLSEGLCLSCYYLYHSRMGGAAVTYRDCAQCDKEMVFGSTATDLLCKPCGKENGLCVRCSADIELKERRTPYPFQNKEGL